jgi:hypothetical protein
MIIQKSHTPLLYTHRTSTQKGNTILTGVKDTTVKTQNQPNGNVPIFLQNSFSDTGKQQTYKNIMANVQSSPFEKCYLPEYTISERDRKLPDAAKNRMIELTKTFKTADSKGNIKAKQAAHDEAVAIRIMHYCSDELIQRIDMKTGKVTYFNGSKDPVVNDPSLENAFSVATSFLGIGAIRAVFKQGKKAITKTFKGATDIKDLTKLSVETKLEKYLLDLNHPTGGSKAKWFKEALGFTQKNADKLAKQIVFDPKKAEITEVTQHGAKYNQVISIKGANGKVIDVKFAWIKNNDGVVRLVTAIPTKLK